MNDFSKATEINQGVYWVGVKDPDKRLFDAFIKLPRGTSYNSYLIKGSKATALVDTVYRNFSHEWSDKINSLIPLSDIEHLIMNHAEQDHASSIPYFLSVNDKAKIYMTKPGVALATKFYQVPAERIVVIKDGDEIDLGGKTLRFIEAPMLHWPETMFSYLVEDKILFSCDFFGAHIADGFFASEVTDVVEQAKKYFAEIMMPYRNFAQKAMDKLDQLDLSVIAPSHGPIYRETAEIYRESKSWIRGDRTDKVVIAYVSMWGETKAMAETMTNELSSRGVEAKLYDLTECDLADIAKDLVDAKALVLGAPAVLNQAHPLASYAISVIDLLKPQVPYIAILGSYGWAKTVERCLVELVKPLQAEMIGAVEIKGPADEPERDSIIKLADAIADKIKS